MGTTRTFNALLNDYLPEELLKEELIKRDFVLNKIEKDNSWKGGNYVVPFKASGGSSIQFNSLPSSTDIAESNFQRGTLTAQKEVWGSMIFNQRDLMEHDGKIPETTFLRILPDEVDSFIDYMKQVVSTGLTSGPHFATATGNGAVGGTIKVDHIDRFNIGQKVSLVDGDTAAAAYYVTGVDLNADTLTLSATRGGAAADVSAYTTAQVAKFYHPGVTTSADTFQSMRQAFLSAANGGDTTIAGKTKTAYPILQAYNYSGAGITSYDKVLPAVFDAYTAVRARGRGNVTDVVMSYKHLGSVMKWIEGSKGAYRVTKDPEANLYGWTTITVGSVKGDLNIVGVQEMDDDIILGLDWSSMKFATNGLFRKRTAPDGKQYYEVRNTTGYQYIVDVCLFGDMVYTKPSSNFIIYGANGY